MPWQALTKGRVCSAQLYTGFTRHMEILDFWDFYLRQGGYVFGRVCLFVGLLVT